MFGLVDLQAGHEVLMLYTSFMPAIGPGLRWSYARDAQGIAVGITGAGVEPEGFGRPLSWEEFASDLRLAGCWRDEVFVYSLEGCVRQGYLAELVEFDWEKPISPPTRMARRVDALRRVFRGLLLTSLPWGGLEGGQMPDALKLGYQPISANGLRVLRFTNRNIGSRMEGVLGEIVRHCLSGSDNPWLSRKNDILLALDIVVGLGLVYLALGYPAAGWPWSLYLLGGLALLTHGYREWEYFAGATNPFCANAPLFVVNTVKLAGLVAVLALGAVLPRAQSA
jgi:hypothetical protein